MVPGLMLSRAILDRIVVGQQLLRRARRIAVVRRGDGLDHLRDGLARVDRGVDQVAAAGDGVAARRVADVLGKPERRNGGRIGEGQPVLPGIVGAQHVGQVGAVGVEMHARRVGGAEQRVGLGADEAGMHVAAAALADLLHELLEPLLVALGPGRAHDAPLPGRRRCFVRGGCVSAGAGLEGLRGSVRRRVRSAVCAGRAGGTCGSRAARSSWRGLGWLSLCRRRRLSALLGRGFLRSEG